MTTLTAARASDLSLPPNTYIYKVLPTGPRTASPSSLAVLSSDDSVRFVDPSSISLLPDGVLEKVHDSVTCLERAGDVAGNIITTAGRDGIINFWDSRQRGTGKAVMKVQCPQKLISSIVCNGENNFLAAGIENPNDGPAESPVFVWDTRKPSSSTLSLIESHTDTITTLSLHPSHPSLLLSSSTDGLLNIFNTTAPDEDEALYQVINHRSAVAHAGFLYPSTGSTDMYALGTDETVAFYALQSQNEEEAEPAPRLLGDVRDRLECEYLVGMVDVGSGEVGVAAGKHSTSSMSLIPVQRTGPESLAYDFDVSRNIVFSGAHGEEIVRDVFYDMHSNTAYTAGEDGHIRAWAMPASAAAEMAIDSLEEGDDAMAKKEKKDKKDRKERKKEKKDKKEKKEKDRFKPY